MNSKALRKSPKDPKTTRSRIMSRVGQRDTQPEMLVRSAAHGLGLRFRICRRDLPGTPDLVFPKWQVALFVHGCFWHRHRGCPKATKPKTSVEFWNDKFARNIERDARKIRELKEEGWRVETIWECQTADRKELLRLLSSMFRH